MKICLRQSHVYTLPQKNPMLLRSPPDRPWIPLIVQLSALNGTPPHPPYGPKTLPLLVTKPSLSTREPERPKTPTTLSP